MPLQMTAGGMILMLNNGNIMNECCCGGITCELGGVCPHDVELCDCLMCYQITIPAGYLTCCVEAVEYKASWEAGTYNVCGSYNLWGAEYWSSTFMGGTAAIPITFSHRDCDPDCITCGEWITDDTLPQGEIDINCDGSTPGHGCWEVRLLNLGTCGSKILGKLAATSHCPTGTYSGGPVVAITVDETPYCCPCWYEYECDLNADYWSLDGDYPKDYYGHYTLAEVCALTGLLQINSFKYVTNRNNHGYCPVPPCPPYPAGPSEFWNAGGPGVYWNYYKEWTYIGPPSGTCFATSINNFTALSEPQMILIGGDIMPCSTWQWEIFPWVMCPTPAFETGPMEDCCCYNTFTCDIDPANWTLVGNDPGVTSWTSLNDYCAANPTQSQGRHISYNGVNLWMVPGTGEAHWEYSRTWTDAGCACTATGISDELTGQVKIDITNGIGTSFVWCDVPPLDSDADETCPCQACMDAFVCDVDPANWYVWGQNASPSLAEYCATYPTETQALHLKFATTTGQPTEIWVQPGSAWWVYEKHFGDGCVATNFATGEAEWPNAWLEIKDSLGNHCGYVQCPMPTLETNVLESCATQCDECVTNFDCAPLVGAWVLEGTYTTKAAYIAANPSATSVLHVQYTSSNPSNMPEIWCTPPNESWYSPDGWISYWAEYYNAGGLSCEVYAGGTYFMPTPSMTDVIMFIWANGTFCPSEIWCPVPTFDTYEIVPLACPEGLASSYTLDNNMLSPALGDTQVLMYLDTSEDEGPGAWTEYRVASPMVCDAVVGVDCYWENMIEYIQVRNQNDNNWTNAVAGVGLGLYGDRWEIVIGTWGTGMFVKTTGLTPVGVYTGGTPPLSIFNAQVY